MSNYDGEPDWAEVALLDDSTIPDGAEIDVPLETLTDRDKWLRQAVNRLQAMNFPVHPDQSSIGEMKSAAYDPKYRQWYVVGASANVRSSNSHGLTWPSTSEVSALASGEGCVGLDVDTSGNVVVVTDAAYVFEKTASTGVWTKPSVSLVSPSGAQVVYDPVNSKWVLFAMSAGSPEILTSTNRTTWSAGTPPTSFGTTSQHNMGCNKATGRIVLAAQATSGTTIKIRTSDDAGASWTTRSDVSCGISPVDNVALVRDTNVAERWLLVVNRTTGAWNSEVWESTDDGETFTRICQYVTNALFRCAPCGDSTLVGISLNPSINRYEIVFSLDGGATWYPAGVCLAGSMRGAFSGGDGVAVVTSSDIFMGARAGSSAYAALT